MSILFRLFVSLVFLLSVVPPSFSAAPSFAISGTKGCGGRHGLGPPPPVGPPGGPGTEIVFSNYIFRNFNSGVTQTITSITIKEHDGTVAVTLPNLGLFPVTGYPPGFDAILGPMQSTEFNTTQIPGFGTGGGLDPNNPLQVIVEWIGSGPGVPLAARTAVIHRARDVATGNRLEIRAHTGARCRDLP